MIYCYFCWHISIRGRIEKRKIVLNQNEIEHLSLSHAHKHTQSYLCWDKSKNYIVLLDLGFLGGSDENCRSYLHYNEDLCF